MSLLAPAIGVARARGTAASERHPWPGASMGSGRAQGRRLDDDGTPPAAQVRDPMRFVACSCGATNSPFTPSCTSCGARVIERPPGEFVDTAQAAPEAIGAYRVLDALGAGALSTVHRAISPDGTEVALKIVRPRFARSDVARMRIRREALALRAVRHPSVAALIDVFEHDNAPVLVLELVQGTPLRAVLTAGSRMSVEDACSVIAQLADALSGVHENGWIHRDVKPENIMLLERTDRASTAVPRIKLLDLGLARMLVGSDGEGSTAAGSFVGSIAYASPEQLLSLDVGTASDAWALGVVAFELLSGRLPYAAGTIRAIIGEIVHGPRPALEGAPAELARIVRALLSYYPADRPALEEVRRVTLGLQAPDRERGASGTE